MKITTTLLSILILTFTGKTQVTDLGFQFKTNLSNQFTKVLKETNETSIEHDLLSLGGDLYVDYKLSNHFSLNAKLGYEQKGFTNKILTNVIGLNTTEPISQNIKNKYQFNYLALDLNVKYYINTNNIKPYLFGGISTGSLLSKKLISSISEPDTFTEMIWNDNFNKKYNSYSNYNFGFITGLGINYKNIFWTELEFNRDIISPIKSSSILVKNRVYSINLGLNIFELFKK